MNGTYSLWLVALSFAVAALASYVALDLASHVTASKGRAARNWLIGGALSMGLGIWSMHFIGMLAFRLPMHMSYSISITAASLVVAILVSGFALRTVSRESLGTRQLVVGAILMGVGIASMHYVGMAAMQVTPSIRYDPVLFASSILIAIAASGAALWIAFSLRGETILSAFWRKGGSALVMGAAICGMHYTGMAAAIFAPTSMATSDGMGISDVWLAVMVAGFGFLLLGTTLLVSMFDARRLRDLVEHQRSGEALRASKEELEALVRERTHELEQIQQGLIERQQRLEEAQNIAHLGSWDWDVTSDAISWSEELHRIFGTSSESLVLKYDAYLQRVHPDDRTLTDTTVRKALETLEPFAFDHRIVRPDGTVRNLQAKGRVIANDQGDVVRMLGTAQDVTELKEAEQRLLQLAHFDPLTALPNRTLFYETLRDTLVQATEHGWTVSVLFLDIDRFKNVNDTMGHAAGDELLRQVGRRLMQTLRVRDTVGRLGGDEFAIILISPDKPDNAAVVAQKLRDALRQPFKLGTREVTVTASVGITVFPDDSTDAEGLVQYADTAMYAAKESGRDAFRFYTAAMNATVVRRLELENALRHALENDEFVLYYQPKIDLGNGNWAGVEALIRWNRPGHGLVSPGEFIPLLEETGMIEPVGVWVVQAACRQIVAWIAEGIGPVPIAVNVSVKQLLHAMPEQDIASRAGDVTILIESPALERAIEQALKEHAIATQLLEIELTESALMLHAAQSVALLQRLKSLGIRISIDDFGTGYSSLAYLKRFPINTVKIDQTFVRDITTDPDDAAITVAIISLAHSLKLKVVAEGVETREQLEFLRSHHCDQAQGYLLARPMPADAVAELFRTCGGQYSL